MFLFLFALCSSPFISRAHRLGPSDDEMYQRTTVSVMQKEPGSGMMIQSYSPRGFNIDGNKVVGPCAVLPPAILQWNVREIIVRHTIVLCFNNPLCLFIYYNLSFFRLAVTRTSQRKVCHSSTCLNQE